MRHCENCGKSLRGEAALCRRCLRELGVSPEGMGEDDAQADEPRLGRLLSPETERSTPDDARPVRGEDEGPATGRRGPS